MSGRSRFGRTAFGEAGAGPALVLAGVALVTSFISIAGARALLAADNTATAQAISQLLSIDKGAEVTADLNVWPATGVLPAGPVSGVRAKLAAGLPRPQDFLPGQAWGGISMPALFVANPAPSAQANATPKFEVGYRADLASFVRVSAGKLPSAEPRIASAHGKRTATFGMAVTKATAARFSLRIGSVMDLFPVLSGDPEVLLRVTAILTPTSPSVSFWQLAPEFARPSLEPLDPGPPGAHYWLGAGFLGPRELTALGITYQGSSEQATWFFPTAGGLTAAEVPRLESSLNRFAASPRPGNAVIAAGAGVLQDVAVTNGLADGLSPFESQWHAVAQADSVLLVGLFVAGAMLLVVCSELAAAAYRSELLILRVRGGSMRQLVLRMLTRSCLVALLPVLAGSAAAIAVLRGSASTTSWLLGGLTAATALGSLPAIAFAAHRDRRTAASGRVDDVVSARPRFRRLVGELLIVLAACAAIAELRSRGPSTSDTVSYLSASAVLVAAAVGLIVNRGYRGPLRAAARVAGSMRGPIGAVGLTRAAFSRISSVAPALVLLLTLTLVTFAGMVMAAVSTGQVAASWAQTGGDAEISVPGLEGEHLSGVTRAELHATASVSGVRHVTSVYTALSTSDLSVAMRTGPHSIDALGIAVVNPASYGALSADTPWPGFPSAALSRPRGGTRGVVPILATPDVQAQATRAGGRDLIEVGGLNLPVRIIGTVTDTPAMPAGGSYVILPQWAAYRLPSLPMPTTILATGAHLDGGQLAAAVGNGLPGGTTITLRSQVLRQLARSPALRLSRRLYIAGALGAALLSIVAVLFALAGSARSRAIMMMKLTALGMPRRQALALGLTDALPLLAVAAIGSAASGWLLAVLLRPVLGLGVFTDSVVPVPLEPTWPAIVVPIAAAAAVAIAYLGIEGILRARHNIGSIIRLQEASQT